MPLCGFNKKMLNGLMSFHRGLVEHGIIERSKEKNQSIQTTIKKELEDMKRFQNEINLIQNQEIKKLIKKPTEYASAFYKLIQKEGVKEYLSIIEKINTIYLEMDKKYYSELEGKKDDMKSLAKYLNNLVLAKII